MTPEQRADIEDYLDAHRGNPDVRTADLADALRRASAAGLECSSCGEAIPRGDTTHRVTADDRAICGACGEGDPSALLCPGEAP